MRIAVFQPRLIDARRTDLALVGAQLWLASRVSERDGMEGLALMSFADDEAPRDPIAASDGDVDRTMAMMQARLGLTSCYARQGARLYCERACLLESRTDADAAWLATRELDVLGVPLAVGAQRMLQAIVTACGAGDDVPTWSELFDTEDADVAADHLVVLGCYAAAIQGATSGDPSPAFAALLCGVATRHRPTIRLLPMLIDALEVSRTCSDAALTGLVCAAVDIFGAIPAEWATVCATRRVDPSVRTRTRYALAGPRA